MSDFVDLREIKMPGLCNPIAGKQETIADTISEAHKKLHVLRESMLGLAERSGVSVATPTSEAQNAIASNMHALAQDLLRTIESCHDAMRMLNRIA
jgi:hypothetical protein